jgi:molybdopterin-binding protein
VLLLDEPISALDPESRENVRHELRQIHEQLRITVVHVTHDFEEAVALGERIAVLNEGQLVQMGTPEEIFRKPNSEFVARFAMSRNIFAGEARDSGDGYSIFITGDMELAVTTELHGKLHASIRPEDILVSTDPLSSSARNFFRGTITHISDAGSTLYLTVTIPPDLICLVTRRSFEDMDLREGKEVYVTFKATAVNMF